MNLRSELASDLDNLVNAITKADGVVAIILFGSRARGDYDEGSDYDLLVIFKDDEAMWGGREKLYREVGKLGLFTQILTRSVRELKEGTEPTFLQNVLEQGIIVFLRHPFTAPAIAQNLRPVAAVSYSLAKLPQNEKVKIAYRLFGKRGKGGVVQRAGGVKVGDGCFIIPMENLREATKVLEELGAQFDVIRLYASKVYHLT